MSWNGKKYGETGKGDKPRGNLSKVSKNMEKVKKGNWRSCGGCKHFKNGFSVLGHTLCKIVEGFDVNKDVECEKWEDLHE